MELRCTTCGEFVECDDECLCERNERSKLPECDKCGKAITGFYVGVGKRYLYCRCDYLKTP